MITDPKPYADKFKVIGEKAGELLPKFESGDFTLRDMAILTDLFQMYIEALEETANDILEKGLDHSVTIRIEERNIKFQNIDDTANFITSLWRYNATI